MNSEDTKITLFIVFILSLIIFCGMFIYSQTENIEKLGLSEERDKAVMSKYADIFPIYDLYRNTETIDKTICLQDYIYQLKNKAAWQVIGPEQFIAVKRGSPGLISVIYIFATIAGASIFGFLFSCFLDSRLYNSVVTYIESRRDHVRSITKEDKEFIKYYKDLFKKTFPDSE